MIILWSLIINISLGLPSEADPVARGRGKTTATILGLAGLTGLSCRQSCFQSQLQWGKALSNALEAGGTGDSPAENSVRTGRSSVNGCMTCGPRRQPI